MDKEQADRIEQKLDQLLSLGQEILEGVGLLLLCEVGDEPDDTEDDIFPPDLPMVS